MEWLSTCSSRTMANRYEAQDSIQADTNLSYRTNQSQANIPADSNFSKSDETQTLESISPQLTSKFCAQYRTTIDPLTPCSKCDIALYCSIICQRLHWLKHKYSCIGRPLDEADDFILACQQNEFPTGILWQRPLASNTLHPATTEKEFSTHIASW